MQASVRLEHQLLAVEMEHRVHAMLELASPPPPAQSTRQPLRLALVIDRSGSMGGRKLEVTKECAAFLVRRLAPSDELAVITYDDQVELLVPLAPVHQATLLAAISGIYPGGSTNLSGGWLKGTEVLRGAHGDRPRKVLLLTDGLANVGIAQPSALVSMTRRAAEANIGTTTIGFGDDFDEDLLTAMADAGRGKAYYAPSPEDVPEIFNEEFQSLMSIVAQNVSVEIRPSDEVALLGILNEYPNTEVLGGVQLQLGDAYGEERRRVVFELHIPRLASLGVAKIAEIVLRYVSVDREIALHEVTLPLTVNMVSADDARSSEVDAEVREEVLVLKTARTQERARDLADAGEYGEARKLLSSAAGELRDFASASPRAEELLEEAEYLDRSMARMSQEGYRASLRKSMTYDIHANRRRRMR